MAKSEKKKLSKDDRLNALSAVRRSKSSAPKPKATKPAQTQAIAPKFADLPGFKEIRLQKAAADLLQINNPFFRAMKRAQGQRLRLMERRT